MESERQWTTVTRRRRSFPNNWRHAPEAPPATKPYTPYNSKPSYSHVVRHSPPSPPPPARPRPLPQQPNHPTAPNLSRSAPLNLNTPKHAYISPHNPSRLRFPPSPLFTEWKGICFRCCAKGHTSLKCTKPKKCGRCWGEGHVGTHCQIVAHTPPVGQENAEMETMIPKGEPSFEELLTGPYPNTPKPVPEPRPQKVYCFVERDEEYYNEVEKLKGAVVLYAPNIDFDLTLDEVAECAAMTKLVTVKDLTVAILNRSRYLIQLLAKVSPAAFIKAIPRQVWDKGYMFSQWSPLTDTVITIPEFKVLIDMYDVPVHMCSEKIISRVTGTFGVYLGIVEQSTIGDLACWTVAVAITKLEDIPHHIALVVGGRESTISVQPRTWIEAPLYSTNDYLEPPQMYSSPLQTPLPVSTDSSNEEEQRLDVEEMFQIPRRIVVEICRELDFKSIPAGWRTALAGANSEEILHEGPTPLSTTNNPIDPTTIIILKRACTDEAGCVTENNKMATPIAVDSELPLISLSEKESADIKADPLNYPLKVISEPAGETSKNQPQNQQLHDSLPLSKEREDYSCASKGKGGPKKPPCGRGFAPKERGTSARLKNKFLAQAQNLQMQKGPSKKKKKKKANLDLNPEGLLEVRIDFEHAANIAAACNLNTQQVIEVMCEDNADRTSCPEQFQPPTQEDELGQGEHITDNDFDPNSEDELDSDWD